MSISNKAIDTDDIRAVPELLREMRFTAMAKSLESMINDPASNIFVIQKEITKLVLAEYNSRATNKINKFIKKANLKIPCVDIQDLYEKASIKIKREMNNSLLEELCRSKWIQNKNNLIITGGTGTGKTWIACAIAVCACEKFMNVRYYSIYDLILKMKTLNPAEYLTALTEIRKLDLLILDEIGHMPYDLESCRVFFEILDTRYKCGSTMLISNFTTQEWYELFSDVSYAEATLSRCLERAYRFPIDGEDLRKNKELMSL